MCTQCTLCSQNAQEHQIQMDTPQRWATHEDNYSTKWQHSGFLLDEHAQFSGYFKGMEQIICEQGLWPASGTLLAQCEGFKCEAGQTNCCCCRLLFNQPDFVNQKSQLEELINLHGHICDFYPKYHCKLNFVEQYWGAVKFRYCSF